MAELTAKVSVEKVVHKLCRDMAKKISAEHGLLIEDVSFDWVEMIGPEKEARLSSVHIKTRTTT